MVAHAAIFDRVLLAGAVALAATCSLTHRLLDLFLLDMIALCATLGRSCSCTLGGGRASRIIECVCLIVFLLPSLLSRVALERCHWVEMAQHAAVSDCRRRVSLLVARLPLRLRLAPLLCL